MKVFKQLQELVGKKEKNYSAFEDVVGRDRNIEIGDIDKLKAGDLADIVRKFDQYVVKLRKETHPIIEQAEELREKVNIQETQLKCKIMENEEINGQLQELQKVLNTELLKNIQLQQRYEYSIKQNEHLKLKLDQAINESSASNKNSQEVGNDDQSYQKNQIVINADSQLLMFTNEQELQHLRNIFDQLKDDSEEFIRRLAQEQKLITDKELKKRQVAQAEKGSLKNQKKRDAEASESEEEPEEEEVDEEEEEEEEAEEEFTLEELCGNTWDSLAQMNEYFEVLIKEMKEYKAKNDKIQSNNHDLIQNYETQIIAKQKQIDQIYQEKEKANDLRKQLEQDFIGMNQKLTDEKGRNAQLEDKLANLSKQVQELYVEKEQLSSQVRCMKEEKSNLSNEIGNVQRLYEEKEQKQIEEIEELQKEADEIGEENDQLKGELQKAKEDLYLKMKELDNKERQEKLKFAQNQKDMQKLEQKLLEAQNDLEKQIEANHENLQRLKVLEEKRVVEKSKIKAIKDRSRQLHEELNKKKLENAKDLEEKNKQLDILEEEVSNLRSKTNVKEELTKLTLEKDVKIANLQIQLDESIAAQAKGQEQLNQLNGRIQEYEEQQQVQERTLKQLQEKRELGLQEIQKLNAQIDIMKSHSNPSTQARITEIQNLVERASNLNQSSNSLSDGNTGNNQTKFSTNFRTQVGSSKLPKIPSDALIKSTHISSGLPPKPNQSAQSSLSSLPKTAQNEMNYLNEMKKEMEAVYKDYISIAFGYEQNTIKDNKENFMKLEKKINLSIKKAQDLMDSIEDTF